MLLIVRVLQVNSVFKYRENSNETRCKLFFFFHIKLMLGGMHPTVTLSADFMLGLLSVLLQKTPKLFIWLLQLTIFVNLVAFIAFAQKNAKH